jgi:hypothetical protein
VDSVETPNEAIPLTLIGSGVVEAEIVTDPGVAVDEQSIVVRIDGQAVESTYDSATRKIAAAPEALAGTVHTLEVSASDTDGNTTVATTAFGVDPNIITFSIVNLTNPGQPIALGDQFKVALELDGDPGGTPWFIIYNATDPSYANDAGAHRIGLPYEMDLISSAGNYVYEFAGWFYTSWDEGENGASGEDALQVGAALPLDLNLTQYQVTAETLAVANAPVRPDLHDATVTTSNAKPNVLVKDTDTYTAQSPGRT